MFQSFTVKTTRDLQAFYVKDSNFLTSKCLLKIGVLNATCLSDRDKRGFNVMAALRGSIEHVIPGYPSVSTHEKRLGVDIDWHCKYCTHTGHGNMSRNEVSTSLAIPVAMSTMIDEANDSVTGWLS